MANTRNGQMPHKEVEEVVISGISERIESSSESRRAKYILK